MPKDLKPILKKFAIDRTVVVQAAPTVEETNYLLSLFSEHECIAGVVGWLDLSSPTFPKELEKLKLKGGLVGIRPMLQDLDEDDWILKKEVLSNLEVMIDADLPLDLLVKPRHLPIIHELMKALPQLRAVINHLAKPNIARQEYTPWQEHMYQLATYENMMCKLSGMVTEAEHESWSVHDFKQYVETVFDAFGGERVMFGSDWPVCMLAGSYDDVIHILESSLPATITNEEKEALFGKNARQFYRL